ncbi:TonB-dependent receptor domain-containing protein [Caulobacter hibisci]|uniref:TonB-dependent receptor n=1 Tax=Caulobacter hibisci TaxID=2035993 RepID=A0ABS0T274_9CAUL|nr:TonB-dependent receptor [Caulobacter hibisci]MBI1685003.1 TonB-dependent receptor [Caulobacter hibisci]
MLQRKLLLSTSVIAGLIAATAAPTFAFAQSTTAKADDPAEVEELVVTGSRIRRNEFTSSSPIQVINAETSSLEGLVNTAEVLQGSVAATGSFQVNNQLTGYVTDGGPGANSISLRGLGANRTLVLFNGRRVGPAGTRGTVGPVDLNVIPQAIVERQDILKDGASSVYGSDAVAGVINIVTKTNLDGGVINLYTNQSFEGGGEVYNLSTAWGKTFDRGHFSIAAEYNERKILRRGDRDDTSCAADYLFNPTSGARVDLRDRNGNTMCYNQLSQVIRTGNFGDLIYKETGVNYNVVGNSGGTANAAGLFGNTPIPYADLARQTRAGFPDTFGYAKYNNPLYARASAISPVKLYSLYASGGYDLAEGVEAYGEFLFNRRESEQNGLRQFFPTLSSTPGNSFYTSNPNNPYGTTLGTLLPIIPLKSDGEQRVDYFRLVGGLKGTVNVLGGWDWDIYGQYSKSDAVYKGDIIYNDRVLATTGAAACNQSLITISGGNCSAVPTGIRWLSRDVIGGNFNDGEAGFLFGRSRGTTTYEQKMVEGTISGDLFTLPAGKVGAALGFALRKDEIDDTPDRNEQLGNLWGSTSAGRTAGSDTVKEVFGEIEVPLLKGLPLIEALDFSGSARYTDYDSYGADKTYKVGLNWAITPSIRVRATKGTSFRAPALYELYLANQTSFLGQTAIDPCIRWEDSTNPRLQANCAAAGVPEGYTAAGGNSALITTGGGAGILNAETSKAWTVGTIWTPSFVDLSVAVDYYEITVNDEIRQFGSANILNTCYTSANYPGDPLCTLFTRDPSTHYITDVNNSYVNVAEQGTRGIDLYIRYKHEFDFGKLSIDSQFAWQLEDVVELLAGSATEDYNGTTYGYDGPDFTGKIVTRFDRGDYTYQWGVDIIGKASDTEEFEGDVFPSTRYSTTCRNTVTNVTGPCATLLGTGPIAVVAADVYYKQYSEFTAVHSLSVRKKMDDWTIQAGIRNVFDERSPAQSSGQFRIGTAAITTGYDLLLGRQGFVNISKRW